MDATAEEIVEAVKGEVKTHYTKLDKKTEDMAQVIEALKNGTYDKDTLDGHLKDIRSEVEKLAKTADELDKKLARPDRSQSEDRKSAGYQIAHSEEFKTLQKRGSGSTGKLELKAITNTGTEVGGQTLQALTPRDHISGMITQPDQPVMVRDLLPVGNTISNAMEFVQETGFTNNAAPVAEGAQKPESTSAFSLETVPVRTIAHFVQASVQVLADAPQLQSYIDGRLRYGLRQVEDEQILLGDGIGQNLDGLIPNATVYDDTGIPGTPTIVDTIRWAKLQVRKAFYPATAVVLNPEDWALIELLKGTDGNYLYSAFASGTEPRLWGMRVVESDAIDPGDFMVGAFSLAAQIWDRQAATVEVSTEDRDNFIKNMVTIRGEERLALTIYRPEAFVAGAL